MHSDFGINKTCQRELKVDKFIHGLVEKRIVTCDQNLADAKYNIRT